MADEEPLDDALLRRALTPPGANDEKWHTTAEWQRLRNRIAADAEQTVVPRKERRVFPTRLLATAAAVAGIAVVTTLLRRPNDPQYRTLSTERGQRLSARLSDGTAVVLGPSTTLRYAITASARRLELVGLAHFDVVHDTRRPFIIRAGDVEAHDIGTSFTVRALKQDTLVTVAVTEGSVSLRGHDSITIGAGQVGIANDGRTSKITQSAIQLDAWSTGRLSFVDAPLTEVTTELSRWFAVDVSVNDPALATRRISASYAEPTLNAVLEGIARTTGATIVRSPNGITLVPGSTPARR